VVALVMLVGLGFILGQPSRVRDQECR